ncbi:dTDP-4-dehydrorhamnose 3,5-epimerase [Paenibacillus polymyxa]|uniref:dTDP-4-dehydrorhamnose 3,5-epimerase n=1 Tax=Paenibacillus polymyxa (strain SC2) TaxID=886882 RepID=E3EBM3_PAEPS|nr:dTDP-4-dehydrorhamnose 3,5-epimerase [Paenibacillus polymyxa]ADO58841.1 dTDP-4-dehydrorhamnose 3,5-epimerase [Paenibacillus polymyxa SC2]WPQ56446.1 dTDP-4-dehydrorhamnose 3,5-epimerase [Paenibacillus polymyxa]CCI71372.1 dTDP-4-dehydrorhamnose 3,5-epimerase [Paenibacillus polymyxa M1]
MIFTETVLSGVYLIGLELLTDVRGHFARAWCQDEFKSHGLECSFVQCNISYNEKKGTLRGLHYQAPPYEEVKIVRCTKGSIYDVIVDLRPDSPTYKQWLSIELSDKNYKMLYIPKGFAHGYQTLSDNTEVFYQVSQMYKAEYARGVKWDDPEFNIEWPEEEKRIMSEKDQNCDRYRS